MDREKNEKNQNCDQFVKLFFGGIFQAITVQRNESDSRVVTKRMF